MKNGLSIIIRNEEQFEKASKFIGEKYCYVKWVPQMAERETAIVGCAESQRQDKIRTVEFSEFFS